MVESVRMVVSSGDDTWWRIPAGVRSFAYELLRLGSESVANAMHNDDEGARAFTIAVLPEAACQSIRRFTHGSGAGEPHTADASQRTVHLRFTTLNVATFNTMMAGLLAAGMG